MTSTAFDYYDSVNDLTYHKWTTTGLNTIKLKRPNGLYGTQYDGFFGGDPTYFATASVVSALGGQTQINAEGGVPQSREWVGYFYARTTDNYTFTVDCTGVAYLWIGANAVSGYTIGNADVSATNDPILNPNPPVTSSPIALTAGTYYPIRIQYGIDNALLTPNITVYFKNSTIVDILGNGYGTYIGLNYFYYNPTTNGI